MKHARLPERRQRLRFLTLKNAAWFFGALFLLFIAYSLYNELRPRDASREQLSERGREGASSNRKPSTVIEEQPISDETLANSRLIERAPPPPSAAPPPIPTSARRPIPTLKEAKQSGERISITDGADGLRVEVTTTTESSAPPDRF